ncbi:3-oxoacyl-[acyl-carrier-protein] reductase [Pelagirhabdus alkalitolerans]|uniref:3-oxoacyl-[acyl-carrier-protein] reductase n=1 Tax=Pelagirhabdus alkalitolerans TaxID=1612202 RepID=A0A1G6H295_9BACI|nr:3-oxoacyl-[acyl-carrier-protein] reductase [Pelagirhabdus alkalitolerans]SDB88273.1 3-oxoacyl-[acyl-carrier-protein] reductase [Pelagirhabdus alkalitolerans]
MSTKVALVTGASRGIGAAIAIDLAKKGYDVAVNYAGNKERAEAVVKEIEAIGQEAIAIGANVSDESAVGDMVKQVVKTFGSLDCLVNNAGITRDNLMMRMKTEEFDEVIDTNLKGVFVCMKAVTRQMMKQRSGKIINMSSVVGLGGNPGQINYVASKSGVIGMTKTAAKELAPRNINVNAVAPGFIVTDMTDALDEKLKSSLLESIPLNRLGSAEDVAKTVSFLASDDANYLTGQVIQVDGGMVM